MGQALGETMWAGLVLFGILALFGGIALVSGIGGLIALAAGVKAAAKVFFIICGVSVGIPLAGFLFHGLKEWSESAQISREKRQIVRKIRRAETPLIRAVGDLDEKKVAKLLKKGADPNEAAIGLTPLTVAVGTGWKKSDEEREALLESSRRIAKMLLEAGADPNLLPPFDENAQRFDRLDSRIKGITPLAVAITNERSDAVHLLVACGADKDTILGWKDSNSSLRMALWKGSYECLAALLDEGSRSTIWYDEKKGETLIMHLMTRLVSDEKLVLHIIDKIADFDGDMNRKDKDGRTALHYFTEEIRFYYYDDPENAIVPQLISHGADINAQDKDGLTPLMVAAGYATSSLDRILGGVQILVKNGADISVKSREGKTALDIFHEQFKDDDKSWWSEEKWEEYRKIEELLTPKKAELPKVKTVIVAKAESARIEAKIAAVPKKERLESDIHTELLDMTDGW